MWLFRETEGVRNPGILDRCAGRRINHPDCHWNLPPVECEASSRRYVYDDEEHQHT